MDMNDSVIALTQAFEVRFFEGIVRDAGLENPKAR
jgi:hypothetical protein